MMIRTAYGRYVNLEQVFTLEVVASQNGGYNVTATKQKGDFALIARFDSKKAAQAFLDALAAALGRVLDVADVKP